MVVRKKVVVIGGGFAGAYAAKGLDPHFDVTLIDTKGYFEFTPSILRTIVEPSHVRNVQVMHTHYLRRSQVVVDDVVDVTRTHVTVKNGKKKYAYDYLVIASGSYYQTPFKELDVILSQRAHHLRDEFRNLNKARSILIIGGGLVGVELAAEIATHYTDKKIVLVHAMDRLIERQPAQASVYTERFLTSRGVEIVYNEFVDWDDKGHFKTRSGRKLDTDMTFVCVGIKATSSFLKKNFRDTLDEREMVKVNSRLQMKGFDNIFVAGDVAGIREEKTAQNAEEQAKVVVKNICRLDRGNELVDYVSKPRPMVISLGAYDGFLTYKGFMLSGIIPGLLKLFIEWKTMRRYR